MKKSGEKPKAYSLVASKLRERILNRELQPQQQLPTEHELSTEYGVSRITIRKALEILEEEHLIYKKQGRGSFVSPNPFRRIPLLIDYARSVRTHAPQLRRRLATSRWIIPPEEIAEELKLDEEKQLFYCERQDVLKGKTVAFDRAYILSAFAEKLSAEDLSAVDFNSVWARRANFRILSCKQTVEAVAADETVAQTLGLPEGAPVLKGTEVYLTYQRRPTGVFVNYYHPAHISLVSNFSWTRTETEAAPES